MISHVSTVSSLQGSLILIPTSHHFFPNLIFCTTQHSKLTTYASKPPITRRWAPGSPSRIRSTPRTKPTSSLPPTPPHPPPLLPTNSSEPPSAPTPRSFSCTGMAARARYNRAYGITRPSRPVYAQTSSRPITEQHGKEVLEEGSSRERPRGVVLLAPFSNVETLLDTYYIAGFVPLFAPIRTFPFVASKS